MGGMLIFVLGFLLLFRVAKKQILRQMEEKARLKEVHQLELLKAAIDTQEKERSRIAAELHDQVGNDLQTLKLFLHQMGNIDPKTLEQQTTGLLSQTIQDVRDLSHELMPASLIDLGIQEALRSLMARLNATGQITCDFFCEGDRRMEQNVELTLYRIAQELVNNTLKHAQATQIKLQLRISDLHWEYTYEDDGIGLGDFDPNKEVKGLGFKNIESRCQLMGAKLSIVDSTSGFKIEIKA